MILTDIQEFQRLDKYARFIPELGRRETWPETTARVMSFFREFKKFELPANTWAELEAGLLNFEAFPSMRVIQMAGPSLERCEVGAFNCAAVALDSVGAFAELLYVLMQGTGCSFSVESEFIGQLPEVGPLIPMDEPVGPFVIPDDTEGWCDAFKAGMLSWYNGIEIDFDFSAIRPAGSRLATKGGYASGPEPLKELLAFTRGIMRAAEGRQLNSVEVHRIACKVADIVQVGGVRRAATLSHSDLHDEAMRVVKNGKFWEIMPELSQANNSAVYEGPLDEATFDLEWENLRTSGTGERGIIRRDSVLPARRPPLKKKMNNPCVTGDTWVTTTEGPRKVDDLVGVPFTASLKDGTYAAPLGFWKTGRRPVYRVVTNTGYSFDATGNHKVMTTAGWKEVESLVPGDRFPLEKHNSGGVWGPQDEFDLGWLMGNLFGDGTFTEEMARFTYWGDEKQEMKSLALDRLRKEFKLRAHAGTGTSEAHDRVHLTSREVYLTAVEEGMYFPEEKLKVMPPSYERRSSSFTRGLLSGWFDADGSFQGTPAKGYSIRLSSVDLGGLQMAQRMLLRLGVKSTLYRERRSAGPRMMPDGRGGLKEYDTQDQHELVIAGAEMFTFRDLIGFSYPSTRAELDRVLASYTRGPYAKPDEAIFTEMTPLGECDVYDCTVDVVHAFDGNGFRLHNCGEVDFDPFSFCNLSIAAIRPGDSKAVVYRKVRLATIWGTLQSGLTNFRYLSRQWKINVERERLLGVDIPGAFENRIFDRPAYVRKLRDAVIEINREFAATLGLNPSLATTVVKPGGNSGVFLGVGHPVNGWVAEFMIRRVRSGTQTPMYRFLLDQGVPCTLENERTAVFDFLVAAPAGARISTKMTALQQLERWLMLKENWTEHNPSVTIYVGDDEWDIVRDWVKAHWEKIGGLSFFPKSDHVYPLAPIEPVTRAEYEKRLVTFPRIDWSLYYDYEAFDSTTLGSEFACAGGACAI